MRRINILMLILFICLVSAEWLHAQSKFKFTSFDCPGAQYTEGVAINPAGAITGFCSTQIPQHGFLRVPNGIITEFDPPGSLTTYAAGINPSAAISGEYVDHNQKIHGYLRAPDGIITVIVPPGSI